MGCRYNWSVSPCPVCSTCVACCNCSWWTDGAQETRENLLPQGTFAYELAELKLAML